MKKVFKRMAAALIAVPMVMSLVACGGSSSKPAPSSGTPSAPAAAAPSANPIVIRIANQSPATEFANGGSTPLGISTNYFMKTIEERSGGQITCKLFPDGQLAKSSDEIIGGLQNGAFDCAIFNNGGWGDYTTGFAAINVPYLYFSYDIAYATLDSEVGQKMKDKVKADTGLIPVAFFDIGFRHITNSKREIKTPADMKGLKLRTMTDDIQIAAMEALGAAVTPISYSELFTALQQKLVDGQENPVSNIVSAKFYELQPYMTITGHSFTVSTMTFNQQLFDKLTPEQQKLVKDVAVEAQNEGRKATPVIEKDYLQFLKDKGVKVYEPTVDELNQFRDAAKASWTKVEKLMGTEDFNQLIKFVEDKEKELGMK